MAVLENLEKTIKLIVLLALPAANADASESAKSYILKIWGTDAKCLGRVVYFESLDSSREIRATVKKTTQQGSEKTEDYTKIVFMPGEKKMMGCSSYSGPLNSMSFDWEVVSAESDRPGNRQRSARMRSGESAEEYQQRRCSGSGGWLPGIKHYLALRDPWWRIDLRALNHLPNEEEKKWAYGLKRRFILARAAYSNNGTPGVCREYYSDLLEDLNHALKRWPCPKNRLTDRGCK